MICWAKEYTTVIFLPGKGYKIVQLFIVYGFSFPVKEIVPCLPNGGRYFLSNIAIYVIRFLVRYNQLVEDTLGNLYDACMRKSG